MLCIIKRGKFLLCLQLYSYCDFGWYHFTSAIFMLFTQSNIHILGLKISYSMKQCGYVWTVVKMTYLQYTVFSTCPSWKCVFIMRLFENTNSCVSSVNSHFGQMCLGGIHDTSGFEYTVQRLQQSDESLNMSKSQK